MLKATPSPEGHCVRRWQCFNNFRVNVKNKWDLVYCSERNGNDFSFHFQIISAKSTLFFRPTPPPAHATPPKKLKYKFDKFFVPIFTDVFQNYSWFISEH